jgi:hypothetical protein
LQVVGVTMVEVADANSLVNFFAECFDNRAVAATKMNDRSSRSHAIYTVLINRTLVDVSEVGDKVSRGCMCAQTSRSRSDDVLAWASSTACQVAAASSCGAASAHLLMPLS